jgi:nitroimidazol reductase NimA-like FMN-containing flavoprotein (pyridoxamine 5'-phosphate oxidase superfamily)
MSSQPFIESRDEMEAILREQAVGYLGLSMDGQPYVVPINYVYVEGRILMHCALTGAKLDHIRTNPRACFAVARQTGRVRDHADQDPCEVDSDSVLCYGRARILETPEERQPVLDAFNRHFDPDAEPISLERAARCGVIVIDIAEMTGRRERESGRTHWRFAFESGG